MAVTDTGCSGAADDELRSWLAAIVESSTDAIIGATLDEVITSWNAGAAEMFGYTADEMIGRDVSVLFPPDQAGELAPILDRVRHGERIGHFDSRRVRKDGSVIDVSVAVSPVRDASGAVTGAANVTRDITERNRFAQAGTELRSRLAAIADSSTDAIIGKTLDGTITSWNAGAEEMYGYTADEIIGRNISVLIPPERAGELTPILDRVRRGERISRFDTRRMRRDGSVIEVSVAITPVRDGSGTIVGAAAVARDVTERNRAEAGRRASEARLHQAERMETVGQLAGGIAHDFNNLLGAITGYADLIGQAVAGDPAISADVQQIQHAAVRAAQLTRELLIFSRREPTQPENIDLNTIISDLRQLLAASLGGRINLRIQTEPGLPPVMADRAQTEQVLLNLAVNARDAMPSGGTVTIATSQTDVTEGRGGLRPDAGPGHYVQVTMSDTGCGMSQNVVRRAFEPFFTTKPLGKGTGLGLSTVYGIVTHAGGDIRIESEEGMGTTFRLYLPAVCGSGQSLAPGQPTAQQGNGEVVLVVDDEPAVLAVAARMLRLNGYHTLEASTYEQALSLIATRDFQLLLTDAVMPGMSGPALAERARELRPAVRVLHMSGSCASALDPADVASGREYLLKKPFTAHALLDKVSTVLRGAQAG